MNEGLGDRFQRETKYSRETLGHHVLDWENKPETYKTYPSAPTSSLPAPQSHGGPSLWETMNGRRSVRKFRTEALPSGHLSQLLWASQGITRHIHGYELRSSPSAGALYPVETYVSVQSVEGLQSGIYHFRPQGHAIELLNGGDFRKSVASAALEQSFVEDANLVFLWTAVFQRSKWKYRERAYRYVYLDAGHLAQNLALAAVGLGLGSCQVAAFFDDEANALLGIDGIGESVIYMTAVGIPVGDRDGDS